MVSCPQRYTSMWVSKACDHPMQFDDHHLLSQVFGLRYHRLYRSRCSSVHRQCAAEAVDVVSSVEIGTIVVVVVVVAIVVFVAVVVIVKDVVFVVSVVACQNQCWTAF